MGRACWVEGEQVLKKQTSPGRTEQQRVVLAGGAKEDIYLLYDPSFPRGKDPRPRGNLCSGQTRNFRPLTFRYAPCPPQ